MLLRHKPSPFQDVFILSWALCGVYMWHIKRQKDKCKVCQDSATLLPSNQNNTTHEMRLFSIFVTLVMRKMHGFVMKTREKDSRGFSSCSSLSIGFLWDPRHIPERFCAQNSEWTWQYYFVIFSGIILKAELFRAAVYLQACLHPFPKKQIFSVPLLQAEPLP